MPSGTTLQQRGSLIAAAQQVLPFCYLAQTLETVYFESAKSGRQRASALRERVLFPSFQSFCRYSVKDIRFRRIKAVQEKCDAVMRANVLF